MTSEGVASLAKQVGLRVSDDGALWGNAQASESFARQTINPYQAEVHLLRAQRDALLEACRFYASMMGRRKSDGEPFYMTALDLDCGDRARAAIKQAEENA